jgi:hypothetical protein
MSIIRSKPGFLFVTIQILVYSPIVFWIYSILEKQKTFRLSGLLVIVLLTWIASLWADIYEIHPEKIVVHTWYGFHKNHQIIFVDDIQYIGVPAMYNPPFLIGGSSFAVRLKNGRLKIMWLSIFTNCLELQRAIIFAMKLHNYEDRISESIYKEVDL